MNNLQEPDERASAAVDVRQELDLRIGEWADVRPLGEAQDADRGQAGCFGGCGGVLADRENVTESGRGGGNMEMDMRLTIDDVDMVVTRRWAS